MDKSLTFAAEIRNRSTRVDYPASMRARYGIFDLPDKNLPVYDRHDESIKIGRAVAWPTHEGIYVIGTLFHNTRFGPEHERKVRSGDLDEISVGGYVTEEGDEMLDAARFAVTSLSLVPRGALAGRSRITDTWMETSAERQDRAARMRRYTNKEWTKHRKEQERVLSAKRPVSID